jgi:hypothetical protein
MAQWVAKPDLYGAGGGEFIDDTGTVWPDPWGTLAPPAAAPSQGEIMNGMPSSAAQVGEFLQATAPQPTPPAAPHEAPTGAPPLQSPEGMAAALDAPMPPTPTPGFAEQNAAAGGGAAPAPQPGFADVKEGTTSSRTSETGSTGLSAEAQARQGENISAVVKAKQGERDAAAQFATLEADQAAARSKQVLATAAEGLEKTAAQIALNDHVTAQVDAKMKAGAEWRPDRTELFSGDRGAAFGIAAAVAAMAGAWMQGRGLTQQNPYLPTIMKMIEDNANDQVRRNSTTMQFLREQKGDLRAAALELRQRQASYAKQRLEGLALKDQSDLMRAGVAKTTAALDAQIAQWEQEKRQSLERTETNKIVKTFSQTQATGAGPAGGARTPDPDKAQGTFDAIANFGGKAGLIRGPDGKWRVGGGAFPPAALERINPFSDDSIMAAGEAAVEAYGRLQSGGVIGSEERPAFRDQLGLNTLTRAQLAARLNAAETALRARLKSTDETQQRRETTVPEGWKK